MDSSREGFGMRIVVGTYGRVGGDEAETVDTRVVNMSVARTRRRRRGDTPPDEVVQGVDIMDDRGCRCSALADADIGSKVANGRRWTNSLPGAGWTIDNRNGREFGLVPVSCCLVVGFLSRGETWSLTLPSRNSLLTGCLTRRRSSVQTV